MFNSKKLKFTSDLKWLVGVFLVWRGALFLLGASANLVINYQPSFPYAYALLPAFNLPQWLYSWANFDGVHYLTIAGKGYFGTGLIQAFFPVYPLLVKFFSMMIGNQLLTGLILSNFLFIASLLGLEQLLISIYPTMSLKKRRWLLLAIITFPTSFFWGAFYNESLFLCLIIWSFVLMRKKTWFWASLLAGLASATRVIGIFMVLPLALNYWQSYGKKALLKGNRLAMLAIYLLMATSGLAMFMLYLDLRFGDPLLFFNVQAQFGAGRETSLVIYPQVVWRSLKILITARPFNFKYLSYVEEFLAGTLGLLALVYGWRKKLPADLLIFSSLAFFLPTLTGTFSSMPRYILSAPAILIAYSLFLNQKHSWLFLGIFLSTILLIINTMLFIEGYWVA